MHDEARRPAADVSIGVRERRAVGVDVGMGVDVGVGVGVGVGVDVGVDAEVSVGVGVCNSHVSCRAVGAECAETFAAQNTHATRCASTLHY